MYMYIYIYIYVYVYVLCLYMYIYIYIYTDGCLMTRWPFRFRCQSSDMRTTPEPNTRSPNTLSMKLRQLHYAFVHF